MPGWPIQFLRLEPATKLSLNNRGEVAFRSHYFGEGLQLSNTSAILLGQRDKPLEVVARNGDMVEVGPADSREVAVINFPAYEGSAGDLPKALNDRGDLVFQVTFKDLSSGLFVRSSRIRGDFDENGLLDVRDLDAMDQVIHADSHEMNYDLNLDLSVNATDRERWVTQIKNAWFGDANLDGVFDSTDLIQVFQTGEYQDEVAQNSGWADGDWNGDGDFNSGDIVLAFQGGGYENGVRPSVAAVPEPNVSPWLIVGMVMSCWNLGRRHSLATVSLAGQLHFGCFHAVKRTNE